MKTEFLKNLGLDDDLISKIQAESGKDITALKVDIANLKSEIEVKNGIIKTKDKKISELEDVDIDKIKSDEYNRGKADGLQEVDTFKFNAALEKALSDTGAKNIKALKGLIDMNKVKFENDSITGLEEQLEIIKKDNDYLFESSDTKPKFSESTKGTDAGISKESFSKMGYNERLKIYTENPELYKELNS